ncbi:MAG: purine-binding chemotaxis protein CheW [Deltaproteobacteria bacterium]|nr:purine-binding chemotaxis protein CheW [Deltaproteobacteria bacterium]
MSGGSSRPSRPPPRAPLAKGEPGALAPAPRTPRPLFRGDARPVVTIEYLGFHLDQEEYALPLPTVREILKVPTITEVPRAPVDVLGIISVRGTVVTLVDLRRRVGLPERPFDRRTRVLVVDRAGEQMGLVVDSVSEVVRLTRAQIEEAPAVVGAKHAELLAGVGRHGESMWVLLDLGAVLAGI